MICPQCTLLARLPLCPWQRCAEAAFRRPRTRKPHARGESCGQDLLRIMLVAWGQSLFWRHSSEDPCVPWDLAYIALWIAHIPREDREYSSFSAKSFETALAETDTCLKLDALWPCGLATLVPPIQHLTLPFWPPLYFPILNGLWRNWSFSARFEPDSWIQGWNLLNLENTRPALTSLAKRVFKLQPGNLLESFPGLIACFICRGLHTARAEQPQDDLLRPFLKASAPRWFRAPQGRLTKEMAQVLQAGHGIRG